MYFHSHIVLGGVEHLPDGGHAAARLCPNATGADIRSVCTEAGMFAIRARRKTVTEKDFLDAVNKVPTMLC